MPSRKNPPGPINVSSPISISSPIRTPSALTGYSGGNGYEYDSTYGSGGGSGGGYASLGPRPVPGFDEYELSTPSPTHAYLETFDEFQSTPNPRHTPIPRRASMEEKSPFGDSNFGPGGGGFGGSSRGISASRQYGSERFLSPPSSNPRGGATGTGAAGSSIKQWKEPRGCVPTNPTKRRWLFFGVPAALIIIAGIVVGVVVALSHHSSSSSSSSPSSNSTSTSTTSGNGTTTSYNVTTVPIVAGSGSNGSTVETDLGVTFTYVNNFGGSWAQDPDNPYNVSGQAQSWSPSIIQPWVWGEHIVRGVNLGGWLVTEPFIVPALYEQYQNTTIKAIDEYTLSQAMGDNLGAQMEEHYATFITEKDFADIAAAGLNYVRIPLGYWAIATEFDEPFLAQVSWTYFTKAIAWCRKYGLRIYLDFHALPGSQNGWNHSGKVGVVNWMYGVMGLANAQRQLEYVRSLTEYISQDGIKDVVTMIGLVNEVEAATIGQDVLAMFYYQAYELIRSITGYGSGNGPIILLHEGFLGIAAWSGFLSGADRISLDQHPYLAFTTPNTNPWSTQTSTACGWGGGTNDSQSSFGIIIGGEWSNAINDCGLWLDGVDSTPAYSAVGDCTVFDEWMNWNSSFKADILAYSLGNMDALQNWFFWTWKIGNSTELGYSSSPFWHYQLGLQQGWMPLDPRVAGGYCKAQGYCVGCSQFNGTFPASATGAVASPTIAATQLSSYSIWPPTSMGPSFSSAQIALFPTLTQTGGQITLATPTHSADATAVGDGWYNAQDTAAAWTTVNGCTYPNEYNATAVSDLPTALCSGTAVRRGYIPAVVTPAPSI